MRETITFGADRQALLAFGELLGRVRVAVRINQQVETNFIAPEMF